MKRKTSTSHEEAMVRRLWKDPKFASEYLKAALEDEDKPSVTYLVKIISRTASELLPRITR
jgi:DNA-binding phage protein